MITFHRPIEVKEFMGIDFQSLAEDLTTSAAKLCIIGTFITPMTVDEVKIFKRLLEYIRFDGEWQGAYDDQTDYYYWNGRTIVIWGDIANQALILQRNQRNDVLAFFP
nr:MAG TPA: hypothetical protein [Caudoviricetes sp.]DAI20732.1 MAG TPA: hypothetical protein [Caudoviricetes sp.]